MVEHLVNDVTSIGLLTLVRASLERGLGLRLDLLSQRGDELDVDVRLEESGADLLQDGIESLERCEGGR